MDYYERRTFITSVARNAAVIAVALIAVIFISVYDGIPPRHYWLATALAGVLVYSTVSASLLVYFQRPASVPTVEPEWSEDSEPDEEPDEDEMEVTWNWLKETDLDGLIRYVEGKNAVLSRQAVAEWVDPRFYSLRDGDNFIPFPVLMCRVGAAVKVLANGQARYAWKDNASTTLRRLQATLTGAASPPPPAEVRNGSITGDNRSVLEITSR